MKSFLKIGALMLGLTIWGIETRALEIVYPKNPHLNIAAGSTFFVGNTEPDSDLTINSKPVKVWENGSFVEVVTLNDGENLFVLESKKGESVESKTYSIIKAAKNQNTQEQTLLECFPENQYLYAIVLSDNTPLRETPDDNGFRITHLGKDVELIINAKQGMYFRVVLEPGKYAWVESSKVLNHSNINEPISAKISDVSLSSDKNYEYIKTTIDVKVPYKIKEFNSENGLEIEVYGVGSNIADNKIFKPQNTVKNLAIATTQTTKVSKYFIELNHKIWGYDAYYDGNNLVVKIRKAPKIDAIRPLKNITIAIDAGHGGADSGSIGPTGVKEKELNLDMAIRLKKALEGSGANVVMTRSDDTNVPLYERPEIAKKADALIMVSLHANALPDGADPYKKHGTSVFYYNKESQELASVLKNTLTRELGTKDDGLCNRSFVLTRPTMPLSVLVEVAYMIHPTEYTLMLDENFRQKAAEAVKNALAEYILLDINQNVN